MSYDSITNRGEFFSNHYLDAIIGGDLGDLRRRWEEEEKAHQETGRSRLKALAKPFFAARATATEADSDGAASRATSELNGHVLQALGLTIDRRILTFTDTTTNELDVPVAATVETGSGLHLVALEAELADDVDDLFASGEGEQGRLVDPIHKVGEKLELGDPADAVSALFAVDDPPRWVLVVAGGIVLLAERAKWAEGRFLAVDLDTALERNDAGAKGELETIAALFSTDALVPRDGQAVIDQLADNSTRHAVGVSKELREGIRHSIEILANEVIQGRLKKNLGVYAGENRIDPRDLTTQCLRYLYRLLVLLYAESRPELGIVPVDDEVYIAGYSLDRLRELTLTDLDTDGSRNGTHLDQSLRSLFELVNEGYHAENVTVGMVFEVEESEHGQSYEDYLQFPGLDAQLFAPSAVPLVGSVTLRNEPLQKILQLLMLSPEGKGKRADRGFISYAQLGINQLGAVYEGLMAYTGFFADEDLYEVAKTGDPSDGTWVLPVSKADEYPEDVFVTREDPLTGAEERILHQKGSFVFRLSGRDRQRSASYYTPEVLTRCVVKHALAELLGADDAYAPEEGSAGIAEARQMLDLTICEPALGSGAFLNEAIDQLSAEYLKRRQAELGATLDPEQYHRELQKVKAHFALHQSYGVDLNATAVELAEVSLWLNCMHPGLKAPWFGMQLRRGNSLVGCRRETWRTHQLSERPWVKTKSNEIRPPVDRPLTEQLNGDEIHHFLLPGHGWAAVADRSEAKELRLDEAKKLKDWRRTILKAPSAKDAERLLALASGVERLWAAATERLRLAQRSLRRPIEVWGAGKMATSAPIDRGRVIEALEHPDSDLSRLRLVMDAWVGLWFWELGSDVSPPTWKQWLAALEALVGPESALPSAGQLDLFEDLEALLEADEREVAGRPTSQAVLDDHPWLEVARALARREGAWHWLLEFGPAFEQGGFDLQVGNPPWVRPTWDEGLVLAEHDPWWGLQERALEKTKRSRRGALLQDSSVETYYLREVASSEALGELLASGLGWPELVGLQTNLYLSFMVLSWRHSKPTGIAGLLHPESHLLDSKGGDLRSRAYKRLRRHFQFVNELHLFEDVHHMNVYGVHVYGRGGTPKFLQASMVFHPSVVDESLVHDGQGSVPGIQREGGGWDLRPHAARLVLVDASVLEDWSSLLEDSSVSGLESKMLRPVTEADLAALSVLADQEHRLADYSYHWTAGFHEKGSKEAGLLDWDTHVPEDWRDVVLQCPHFSVATPLSKQPLADWRHRLDYEEWDLENLSRTVVPRVNYRRQVDRDTYRLAEEHWGGRPASDFWRVIYRQYVGSTTGERTYQSAMIPPGPTHIDAASSVAMETNAQTALLGALGAGLTADYLFKIAGGGHINNGLHRRLPLPRASMTFPPLLLRYLRLVCLTDAYAPIWLEIFEQKWTQDEWALDPIGHGLGNVERTWSPDTPLRTEAVRRRALVEIDALSALAIGLGAAELAGIYRAQFPVLRKYEHSMAFDAEGRKICKHHQSAGYRQSQLQQQAKDGQLPKEWKSIWKLYEQWEQDPDSVDWMGYYTPPFYRPDREAEMTAAYHEFERRLETGFYGEVTEGASA